MSRPKQSSLSSALAAALVLSAASPGAYAQSPTPAHPAYACPVTDASSANVPFSVVQGVSQVLDKAFDAALGPDAGKVSEPKVFARVAARRVDEARMAELAEVSGCAALIDQHAGCAGYFDTELGSPLSVFMSMKKTAPLRRQFEEAVARIGAPERRRAAQHCIKLISTPIKAH